jgi:hypothetical protein
MSSSAALPALGELVEDPLTGLRTGTLTVNGHTQAIRVPQKGEFLAVRRDYRFRFSVRE